MAEIKCPKCGEVIKLDKSEYDALLNEVKTTEINKEIARLEKEIGERTDLEKRLAIEKEANRSAEEIAKLQQVITELNSKLETTELKAQMTIKDAIKEKEAKITELENSIKLAASEFALKEKENKETFEIRLKEKDTLIDFYKDLKAKMSTKMVGETLEQHCQIQFNSLRSTAFKNAYFEKDNDASDGTKGDYIYRDYEDGVEYISVMFEMKNEMDDTAKKHKNSDFFKKLDEDRKKKGCEYAVLVTTLEADNELYNQGIVDVSYEYDKMYVIRPQFFIPMITILRNAAINNASNKKELALIKEQNIDITNFEDQVKAVAAKIASDYDFADKKYDEVDKMCADMIAKLTAFREVFKVARNHISTAQNRLEDLSVRKLTKNNPTMAAKFAELKEDK